MKKRVVLTLLASLLIILSASAFVAAQEPLPTPASDQTKVDSAYLWLEQQADGRWTTLTTDTASLALLALGYNDKLNSEAVRALASRENADEKCWSSDSGSANCKSLDTALAILALNNLGVPVDEEVDWLLSRQAAFKVSGINWLLQVDTKEASNCSVSYDNKEYVLSISEDKKYSWSGAVPSCLNLASISDNKLITGDEWIRISSSCLDKVYAVSCELSAAVSLPYFFNTLYVSAETMTTPTDVAINTLCIREGANCNYEASLWGAYALMKMNREYTQLLPYLIGEAENNKGLLPDALLFALTAKEEHAVSLLSQQNREGYWGVTGGRGRYWDTALSILSLSEYSPDNVTKARSWLLKNQNSDGSFGTTNKIKDTSLALYSAWPKGASIGANDCQEVYGNFCRLSCESDEEQTSSTCLTGICCKPKGTSGSCSKVQDCSNSECSGKFVTDDFGRRGICEFEEAVCDDNFDNDNDGRTDLDDSDCAKTCTDLGGQECSFNQDCDGTLRNAVGADRCCVGNCVEAISTCGSKGGFLCSEDQSCDGNKLGASDAIGENVCCSESCSQKGLIWPYILVVLILILAGLGYFSYTKGYFDKFFKPKSAPEEKFPPYRPPVRPYYPEDASGEEGGRRGEVETETETELEETMKKLKKYTGTEEESEE